MEEKGFFARPKPKSRCTPFEDIQGLLGFSWAYRGHLLDSFGPVLLHLAPVLPRFGPVLALLGPVLAHLAPALAYHGSWKEVKRPWGGFRISGNFWGPKLNLK